MPLYEFRCRTCEATFEERRPMAQVNNAATCPNGHDNAVRLLSVFASVGTSASGATTPAPMPTSSGGGGCCGGACHS